MTSDTSRRVRESWDLVPDHQELARLFYQRLFRLDPRLEDLFAATEMDSQHGKFAVMMHEIVGLAGDPAACETALRESGARHRGYGVLSRHYRVVGEAFLQALGEATPGGLTDEARAAWAETYTHMAHLMQTGATDEAAPERPAPG